MRRSSIALAALLAVSVSCAGCSASDIPLVGPCSASKRVAPDKDYYQLALTMVVRQADDGFRVGTATPESVDRRKAFLARLRAEWLSKIGDECLQAHASDWIGFYESQADRALAQRAEWGGASSQYEKDRADEADRKRALAKALGITQVRP